MAYITYKQPTWDLKMIGVLGVNSWAVLGGLIVLLAVSLEESSCILLVGMLIKRVRFQPM